MVGQEHGRVGDVPGQGERKRGIGSALSEALWGMRLCDIHITALIFSGGLDLNKGRLITICAYIVGILAILASVEC